MHSVPSAHPCTPSAHLIMSLCPPWLPPPSPHTPPVQVDIAVSTGAEGVVLGGEASYDTSKAALTKWVLGLGYTATDYQAALLLTDQNKGGLVGRWGEGGSGRG